jgi:hypothetical protein
MSTVLAILAALGVVGSQEVSAQTGCSKSASISSDESKNFTDGMVIGDPGNRVYIHHNFPVGCADSGVTDCISKAYIVPGDRVIVEGNCGSWTYIEFRLKSNVTSGWVETAKLKISSRNLESLNWLTFSGGKSTNEIVRDPRFKLLLNDAVPDVKVYLGMSLLGSHPSLMDAVNQVMGGSAQRVEVRDNRYVMLSACRQNSCDEKGFVWVDTTKSLIVGGIVHFFYNRSSLRAERSLLLWSKQAQLPDFPKPFLLALKQWNGGPLEPRSTEAIDAVGYTNIRFAGSDGVIVDLNSKIIQKFDGVIDLSGQR